MGWAPAPKKFQAGMDDVLDLFERRGGRRDALCYIDDFIVAGRSKEECDFHCATLEAVLAEVGLKVNTDKTQPPSRRVVYLGIEYDLEKWRARLPGVKADRYGLACSLWSSSFVGTRVLEKPLEKK